MNYTIRKMLRSDIEPITKAFVPMNKTREQYERYFAENQAGERVTLKIEPSWIFRCKMCFDTQRLVHLAERPLVGFRERVASALRCIPTRREKSTCKYAHGGEQDDANRFVHATIHCGA